ncbi:phage tail protein [Pseudomonas extremorientalis]|uniref:phage tail-collar fiber domain-containing protein n=1 Tax=Pseudomonas extremorientalis TaxID=169669 RepID=UPI002734BAFE|nr:phage tail protein [Pseudomonas extremorientalis]WLG55490.1 phage tail protein [Pseudomonas extremorientalis]
MIDPNSQFFAILTAVGEAKQANADALGIPWKLTEMGVGDANGTDPIPDRNQKKLINERRRRQLNKLSIDPANANILIAEQIIPADEGGWWIREIGLYDGDGDLVAVANCAPSYKPLMSQGSGRTQVVRMNFIVSSAANVVLMIDPAVVLATRKFVTDSITDAINQQDVKQSVLVATTAPVVLAGAQTIDGVAVPVGSRVLVKDQAQGKDNGLYLTTAEIWTRTADADVGSEVTPGLFVHVERGTANGDTLWHLTTDGPIILGTTALTFQWAGGQNAPTPAINDRSKRVANTESVMTQIESPKQDFPAQVYRKNRLINGNFDIWQRGTSGQVGNASGSAQALYGPDRWSVYMPSNSTATWERLAFEPGAGFDEGRYGLRVTRTGSSDGVNISQKIEGVETCAGKSVTVSFYMRSSISHKCSVVLRQSFGVGGSAGGDVAGVEIDVTTEFKKFAVTLDVPSIKGKKRASDGDYLELVYGSQGKGTYSLDLARVQLESGYVATEFERRQIAEELILCQRYFEKTFSQNIEPKNGVDVSGSLISIVYAGQNGPGSQPVGHWVFRVEKRATPSIRLYRPMGDGPDGQWRSGSNSISSANARALIVGTRQASVDNSDIGITPQTYYIHATADAEL